jgi:hypothetical protein
VAASSGTARRSDPRSAPGHDIEVLEKNTDTTWAMFQALSNQHERGFGATEPASLHHLNPIARAAHPELDAVMLEARRNNRVCPRPQNWQRLYEWLPNKPPGLSPVPVTAAEWSRMSDLEKRGRLREHIEWAALQGLAQKVHEALRKLPEDRWHHIGE